MQLLITAPKSTTVSATIEWVTKGGSSIVSKDGRWSLRRNSKGFWRIFDNGTQVGAEYKAKEAAKEYAQSLLGDAGSILSALQSGDAYVHSVRGNGTLRRRHYLTGKDLAAAQEVRTMRGDGLGMAHIANTLHASISHVRRMLNDLAITEELNEMEADQLATMLAGAQDAE